MKTAKITRVELGKEWSNDYGTFYPHRVTFDNSDKVVMNKTKKDAYQVGQEITYEITGEDKIGNKKAKEVIQQSDPRQTSIVRQSSIKTAIDYWSIGGTTPSIEQLTETAEQIENWVNR